MATWEKGLLQLDVEAGAYKPISDKLGLDPKIKIVNRIYQDFSNNIWLTTTGFGVLKLRFDHNLNPTIEHHFHQESMIKNSIVENSLTPILQDREGNMWFGANWKGVSILPARNKGFELIYSDIIGINPSPVLTIKRIENELWIGTDGDGLNIYNYENQSVSNWKKQDGGIVNGNFVQSIDLLNSGEICVGTFSNGFSIYDPETRQVNRFLFTGKNKNELSHNDVRGIIEDTQGNLWIATWGGGLNYLNRTTGKFKVFKHDPSDTNTVSSNNLTVMINGSPGVLWMGSWGGGLTKLNLTDYTFRRYLFSEENENSLSSNNILSVYKDSYGLLWIGTFGGGLCIYDPVKNAFRRFDKNNRLIDNVIKAIQEDNSGNIWVSTRNGLNKYDRKKDRIINFSDADLLVYKEFHGNSVFKDSGGSIYFGGLDGILKINPDELSQNVSNVRALITGFRIFNEEVTPGPRGPLFQHISKTKYLELNYDDDILTFDFSALRYPNANDCEFAIMMEGFEETWRNIGNDKSATYTNLDPGRYFFRVKSRIKGTDWPQESTNIEIYINRPYWSTWWAYSFYVVVFIALLLIFSTYIRRWTILNNKLKVEQILRAKENELHDLKQRLFTNISHELRTPITIILASIGQLSQKLNLNKSQLKSFATIRKSSNHLARLVNELLDFRKLENQGIRLRVARGDFVKFSNEIFLSFKDLAADLKLAFEFSSSVTSAAIFFDRDQMEKVLYNLLNNALKFTPAGGKVEVKLHTDDQFLYFIVKDNGPGIPESDHKKIFLPFNQGLNPKGSGDRGFGLGLNIAREIVALHGGAILLESEPDVGSSFMVKLPFGCDHFNESQIIRDFGGSEDIKNYLIKDDLNLDTRNLAPFDVSGLTLLIVEDNDEIRSYLRELFHEEFNVLDAENGEKAFALATKYLPDLIISDVMMPVMDGITFTRKIKLDVRTSHIPVIILTARSSLIFKKEGYETGADEYVTKPFNETLLKARVRGLLYNRKLLHEKIKKDFITEPKKLAFNSPDEQFLQDINQVIEENVDKNELKIEFVAKELGMSHSVIYKKMKAITGLSLIEFIRDWRLKKAAMLIKDHGHSVAEACYQVGFSDKKYFSKVFKNKFGVSPSAFSDQ